MQAGPGELAEVGAELKAPRTSYPDTVALANTSCQPEQKRSCFPPHGPQQVLQPQEAPPAHQSERKKTPSKTVELDKNEGGQKGPSLRCLIPKPSLRAPGAEAAFLTV